MERFEEAVPLYLKACEVEGKTERTVQSYAETLRHFRRAVDQLQLPILVRAFGPAHVYLFMGWVRDRGVPRRSHSYAFRCFRRVNHTLPAGNRVVRYWRIHVQRNTRTGSALYP